MTRLEALKAVNHEERLRVVEHCLGLGEPWSPKEVAIALGRPLPNISYHVKIMRELNGIRQTRTRPRRGAVEHFYAFTPTGERNLREAVAFVNGAKVEA